MSEPELLREIVEFFAHHAGKDADKLSAESRVLTDLHLDGQDAHRVLSAFAHTYGVDMSGLHWLRYFDDEGFDLLGPALATTASRLSPAFALRWRAARNAEREITLGHLAKVAAAKRWLEPGPEHRPAPQKPLALMLSFAAAALLAALVLVGAVACYGYFSGRVGSGTSFVTAAGLIGATLVPFFLAWTSWRRIARKLESA